MNTKPISDLTAAGTMRGDRGHAE